MASPCVSQQPGHYAGAWARAAHRGGYHAEKRCDAFGGGTALLTPTRVLAALLSRFAYFRFRGLTYALTAAAVFVGVRYVMGLLYPVSDLALLGLYLPLLVADPIVLKRYERPQRERVRTALRKGIITSLGYILMLLLISGLREFLGAGALMGTQVMKNALFPMAQLPSGGFILLALVMCVWRAAAASVKQQMSLGAEHL